MATTRIPTAATIPTKTKTMTPPAWPNTLRRVLRLDEGQDGFHRSWIMLFAEGDYDHDTYGKLHLNHARLERIKRLFDQRVRHIDIAIDQNHDQNKATGWLEQVDIRGPQMSATGEETPAGLWGLVRWTPLGVQLLKDQIYRYFSPEFGPWTDPETHEEYEDVLIGGGLTNRPFLKRMPAIQLSDRDRQRLRERQRQQRAQARHGRQTMTAGVMGARRVQQGSPQGSPRKDSDTMTRTQNDSTDGMSLEEERELLEAGRILLSAKGKAASKSRSRGKSKSDSKMDDDSGDSSDSGDSGDSDMSMDDDGSDGGDSAELDDDGADGGDSAELDDDAEGDTYDDDGGDDSGESATLDELDSNTAEGEDLDDGTEDDDSLESDGAKVPGPRQGRSGKSGLKAGPKKGTQNTFGNNNTRGAGVTTQAAFSEGGYDGRMTLTEMKLREELAEAKYALYEHEVGQTLAGWRRQRFQFSETNAKTGATTRTGRIALAPTFEKRYRHFMLNEGIRLSPAQRQAVSALVEQALSTAVVDLTQRGVSFDQETRTTTRLSEGGARTAEASKSATLDDVARRIALSEGRVFDKLTRPELLDLYHRASKQIRY